VYVRSYTVDKGRNFTFFTLAAPPGNGVIEMTSKRGPRAPVAELDITALPAVPRVGEQRKRVLGQPFPLGVSGNPAGRPLGSRNKLMVRAGRITRTGFHLLQSDRPSVSCTLAPTGSMAGDAESGRLCKAIRGAVPWRNCGFAVRNRKIDCHANAMIWLLRAARLEYATRR
jgi:hypothetical protein